jgi:hypothetical protein
MANNLDLCSGLSELATQVRSITLQLLSSAEPSQLLWAPPGTSNHTLWHAGHALWVADILTIEPITGQSELPMGWEETFGQDSRPGTTSKWPDRSEVIGLLDTQLQRARHLFAEQASSIEERANVMSPKCGWPLLQGIVHGWHDEAKHQGEMHLLAKMWRNQQR